MISTNFRYSESQLHRCFACAVIVLMAIDMCAFIQGAGRGPEPYFLYAWVTHLVRLRCVFAGTAAFFMK